MHEKSDLSDLVLEEKSQSAINFIQNKISEFSKDHMTALTSFGKDSIVLMDLIRLVDKQFPFVWIKPPFLPEETLELAGKLKILWNLNLWIAESERVNDKSFMTYIVKNPNLPKTNPISCCEIFKVQPIMDFVKKHNINAWFSGLRKTESECRAHYTAVWKQGEFTKLHPILDWTEEEVWQYIKQNSLPVPSHYSRGYRSLGCECCSQPSKQGEDERGGRWADTTLIGGGCGIHRISPLGISASCEGCEDNDQEGSNR